MTSGESTCWTVIAGAAAGNRPDREEFARRYHRFIRAYLGARWRNSPCQRDIDDAVQEVFVECFKAGGVLERVRPEAAAGFRPFLRGVVLNVALRFEARRARGAAQLASESNLEAVPGGDDTASQLFDRAWAEQIMREAGERQAELARHKGEEAGRRVELLRLRFRENLPIRDIAERWQMDAAVLHHQYAQARQEFHAALLEVLEFHRPGSREDRHAECLELLALLQ